MTMPITFPDWMPWWMQLAIIIAALLVGLAFLAMPFSVFGVKSRLESIDARLDELAGELRALSLRLPEPDHTGYDTPALLRAAQQREARQAVPLPPPIPPASWEAEPPPREQRSPTLRAAARLGSAARLGGPGRERAEPRLGQPR